MIKTKPKKLVIIAGILSLLTVLLVGNVAYSETIQQSQLEMNKAVKAKNLEVEQKVRDSAIKTFVIDTKKYKTFFMDDLSDAKNSTTSDSLTTGSLQSDVKNKVSAADFMLVKEHILKKGDKIPVFFLGENGDEVLVAIKHKDGNMSLIKYDVSNVSKQYPTKTDRIDKKEVN
ncbi:hypothetical protein [Desulfosporosinus sp. FKA]|uniref:hypothetical protein n=1 Tax=Desulfosporosinus sp. FKA TaxID=1969834 RepID=UPI000B4A3ABE|nr:hypothetical protein [Desulfosporosinus sp. FKA]